MSRAAILLGPASVAVIAASVLLRSPLEDALGEAAAMAVLIGWCASVTVAFFIAIVRKLVEGRQDELEIASTLAGAALFVLTLLVLASAVVGVTGAYEAIPPAPQD